MKPITADSLARAVNELATYPEVAFQIEEAVHDENISIDGIGQLIIPDPALSAALLRLANSASYSSGREIDTVAKAVFVIGMQEVRDLSYGICAAKTFEGIPNELVSVENFWMHSLYCAVAARRIGLSARNIRDDALFTAGLLHDIGHLVMFSQQPEMSKTAIMQSIDSDYDLTPYVAERAIFGFDHSEVGAALARKWGLPESLTESIRWHHDPYAADETDLMVLAIHVANCLAVMVEIESTDYADAPQIDPRAIDDLGLDMSKLAEETEAIKAEADQLLRLFAG